MTEYKRNPAVRVSCTELERANTVVKKSNEQKSPRYLKLPSGVKANRVLISGTLTDVLDVQEDGSFLLGNIVDGSGEVTVSAGETYQQTAHDKLSDCVAPEYVTVIAKVNEVDSEPAFDIESMKIGKQPRDMAFDEIVEHTKNRCDEDDKLSDDVENIAK